MVKTWLKIILVGLSLMLLVGCNKVFRSQKETQIIVKNDDKKMESVTLTDSVELNFYNIIASTTNDNFVFSPYSILDALSLLQPATTGEVQKEFAEILGITDEKYQEYRSYDEREVDGLEIANKAYFDNGNKKSGVLNLDILHMDDIEEVKMSEAEPIINKFVNEKTHGKIKNIVTQEAIKDLPLMLVNALYFNQRFDFEKCVMTWEDGNNYEGFVDSDYHVGNIKEPTDKIDVLKLDYFSARSDEGDRKFSLYIICDNIHSKEKSVDEFMSNLTGDELKDLLDFEGNYEKMSEKYDELTFRVANFELESTLQAKEILKSIGVTKAFDDSSKGFESLGDNLYIGDIAHKAWIRTDKSGTEAAAATAVAIADGFMLAPQVIHRKHVRADKEFAFIIKDNTKNVILFMGKIKTPSDKTNDKASQDDLEEVIEINRVEGFDVQGN